MLLEDAIKIKPSYKVGDIVEQPINIKNFSRTGIGAAKSTWTQNLKSLEREKAYDYFKEKENEMVKVCSHNGNVFAIEPPLFVELTITDTEPGFKGDTATGASKPATVETGATVSVPLFVNTGDVIKIDTRTGEYLSRV